MPAHPDLAPRIETEHLILRTPRLSDLRALQKMRSNRFVSNFLGDWQWWRGPHLIAWALYGRWRRRRAFFVYYHKEQRRAVGAGWLIDVDWRNRTGEIGVWADRSIWGTNLAFEAWDALLVHWFGRCGMHQLHSWSEIVNRAGRNFTLRAGLSTEGRVRDMQIVRGKYRDFERYSILPTDAYARDRLRAAGFVPEAL